MTPLRQTNKQERPVATNQW